MRTQPADVTPVEHLGIRYEAPHWGRLLRSEPNAAPPSREIRMAQVLREKMLEGSDLTLHHPDDPDWIRATLSAAGFDAADIDSAVARRHVETVLGRVARAQMQTQMMSALQSAQGFGEGGPLAIMGLLERNQILADLASEGLTPDQIGLAMQSWDHQVESLQQAAATMQPQNGGYVVARRASTQEKLWTVQVYRTEDSGFSCGSELFITHLEIEDNHLLIVDETRRVYRLDLATRTVEQLPKRSWPQVEERDYEIYLAVLQFLTGQHGIQDWVLIDEARSFPNNGAVLEYTDPGGTTRRLTPVLSEGQDTRLIQERFPADSRIRVQSREQEFGQGVDPRHILDFSRVCRDPELGEAVLTASGPAVGPLSFFVIFADSSVARFDYKWDYGGAYGLEDEALTSEEVLTRAMPGLLQRLDRARERLAEG